MNMVARSAVSQYNQSTTSLVNKNQSLQVFRNKSNQQFLGSATRESNFVKLHNNESIIICRAALLSIISLPRCYYTSDNM